MPFSFWILDTYATNTYIMFSKLHTEWKENHKGFLVYLAWEPVKGYYPMQGQSSGKILEVIQTWETGGVNRRGFQVSILCGKAESGS